MSIKLYDLPLSPNARKVRAVILELGLTAELEAINLREGKHKTPEFRKLNPNGKLPTLVDGDFVLWESNAIITYLANREGRLMPKDAKGQALVTQWLFWQSAHYGQAAGKVGFERVLKPLFGLGTADEAVVAAGTKEFETLSTVLNNALEGKEYVCGELTVADFSLAPTVDFAIAGGLNLDKHPNVKAWYERMQARDSYKKSAAQG